MFIAYMLELHRTLLVVCLDYIAHYLLLLENTCVLTLFCHRTIREPFSLTLLLLYMYMFNMIGGLILVMSRLQAVVLRVWILGV